MKKKNGYFDALKKVEWPTQKRVLEDFIVTIIGICIFVLFFIMIDMLLGQTIGALITK
ncbi:MAG: preprotein translocase subunit SecE [Mycoplasmatales bacterium]